MRAGKIVGNVGKALDQVFHGQIAQTEVQDNYRKKFNYEKDIRAFVKEFEADDLFDNRPGRKHKTFPVVSRTLDIANPEKLKGRLMKYSKNWTGSLKLVIC